jgi:hypothetical protein
VSPPAIKRLELGTKVFKAPTPSERKSARSTEWGRTKDGANARVAPAAGGGSSYVISQTGNSDTNKRYSKPSIKHHLLLEPTIERQKRKRRLIKARHRTEIEDGQDSGDDLPLSIALAKKRMSLARISKVENRVSRHTATPTADVCISSSNHHESALSRPRNPFSSGPVTDPELAVISNGTAVDLRSLLSILSSRNDCDVSSPDEIRSQAPQNAQNQGIPFASKQPRHSSVSPSSLFSLSPLSSKSREPLPSSPSVSSESGKKKGRGGRRKFLGKTSLRTRLGDPEALRRTREIMCLFSESRIPNERHYATGYHDVTEGDSYITRFDDVDRRSRKKKLTKQKRKEEKKNRKKPVRHRLDFGESMESSRRIFQPELIAHPCPHDRLDDNIATTRTTAYVVDCPSRRPMNAHEVKFTAPSSDALDLATSSLPRTALSRSKSATAHALLTSNMTLSMLETRRRTLDNRHDENQAASTKPPSISKQDRMDDPTDHKYPSGNRDLGKYLHGRSASMEDAWNQLLSDGIHVGRCRYDHRFNPTLTSPAQSPASLYATDFIPSGIHDSACVASTLEGAMAACFSPVSTTEGSFSWGPSLPVSLMSNLMCPSLSSSSSFEIPFLLPFSCEVSMLVEDRRRRVFLSARSDVLRALNLCSRQGTALEMLMLSTDQPAFLASLHHFKSLHRNSPLSPMISKIVTDADLRRRALMAELFLRQLTAPVVLGGLGYTEFQADSILFLLRPVMGSNFGLETLDVAKLLTLGLTTTEAQDLLPYIRELERDFLATTSTYSRQLLNVPTGIW